MQLIINAIFAVVIILISVSLMCQLRIRFYDFYAEYGKFLWSVFIIQAFVLIISTIIEVLNMYNDAVRIWVDNLSEVTYEILYVLYIIVT